jgi:hypothetical protein
MKSLSHFQVIALAGFAISLVGLVSKLINREFPAWLAAISLLTLLMCAFYLTHQWLTLVFRFLHPHLVDINPWLGLVLLVLNSLILYHIWPVSNVLSISFDPAKAAVFNSYQHQPMHTKYLEVRGVGDTLSWIITDEGRTGSFRFKINANQEPSYGASSGAYITFYGQPCDRLRYRTIRFRFKVTDASGNPDVGIRLAVDNPKATGDRELISYEIQSLAKYGPIKNEWQTFEIPVNAFQQVRYEPPFPEGLNENTINKIVFFVNNQIVEQCREATFWFSDIVFRP